MASYNGERCIRLWELPSFEARGTLGDVNNARAMAGSAGAQLVFSGDEHGRVKVRAGAHGLAGWPWVCEAGAVKSGPRRGGQLLVSAADDLIRKLEPPSPLLPLQVWKWKAPAAVAGFPQ